MKVLLTFLLSFCLVTSLIAQKKTNGIFYAATETHDYSYDELVEYASRNFSEKPDIAKFFYYWISLNIAYDFTVKLEDISHSKAVAKSVQTEAVFKNRKTTCLGFTNLYESFLSHFEIEHRLIVGYSRQANNTLLNVPPRIDHAWSAIRYDDQWKVVEITWAGAFVDNPKLRDYYFDMPFARIRLQHLPKKPKWQLSDSPIDYQEFANAPAVDPWYIAHTGTDSPLLSVDKNDAGELVISCIKPRGWRLLLKTVNEENEVIDLLKFKTDKKGKSLSFTLKNYDGSSIIRMDASRIGKDNVLFSATGLLYLSAQNLKTILEQKKGLVSDVK